MSSSDDDWAPPVGKAAGQRRRRLPDTTPATPPAPGPRPVRSLNRAGGSRQAGRDGGDRGLGLGLGAGGIGLEMGGRPPPLPVTTPMPAPAPAPAPAPQGSPSRPLAASGGARSRRRRGTRPSDRRRTAARIQGGTRTSGARSGNGERGGRSQSPAARPGSRTGRSGGKRSPVPRSPPARGGRRSPSPVLDAAPTAPVPTFRVPTTAPAFRVVVDGSLDADDLAGVAGQTPAEAPSRRSPTAGLAAPHGANACVCAPARSLARCGVLPRGATTDLCAARLFMCLCPHRQRTGAPNAGAVRPKVRPLCGRWCACLSAAGGL